MAVDGKALLRLSRNDTGKEIFTQIALEIPKAA
jgi:hypothetical protein